MCEVFEIPSDLRKEFDPNIFRDQLYHFFFGLKVFLDAIIEPKNATSVSICNDKKGSDKDTNIMLFLNICKTYNHPSDEITKKVQYIIKTLSNEYETFYNHSGDEQSSQDSLIEHEDVGKKKAFTLKNESSKSTHETQDKYVTKKIVTQEPDDVDTDDAETTNSTTHQYPNVKPSIHGDVEIPCEANVQYPNLCSG